MATVLEHAVDLLITKLEKDRLGKSARPRKTRGARHGHVTRAARREVFERDGEQCCFVSEDGQQCSARAFLELDHVRARALGGSGDPTNLRPMCRAHNLLFAEETFGKRHVENKIASRRTGPRARSSTEGDGTPPASAGHMSEADACTTIATVAISDEMPVTTTIGRGGATENPHGQGPNMPSEPLPGSDQLEAGRYFRHRKSKTTIVNIDSWTPLRIQTESGLVNIEFRASDARRALDVLHERLHTMRLETPTVEQLLREALAVLC